MGPSQLVAINQSQSRHLLLALSQRFPPRSLERWILVRDEGLDWRCLG